MITIAQRLAGHAACSMSEKVDCINASLCSACPVKSWKHDEHKDLPEFKDNNITGCCRDCNKGGGYFNRREGYSYPAYKRALNGLKAKYGFTKEHGFFDFEKKCCKLPRLRRSRTCLKYECTPMYKALKKMWGKCIGELLQHLTDKIIMYKRSAML